MPVDRPNKRIDNMLRNFLKIIITFAPQEKFLYQIAEFKNHPIIDRLAQKNSLSRSDHDRETVKPNSPYIRYYR